MNDPYDDLFSDEPIDAEIPPRSRLYHLPLGGDPAGWNRESMLSYLHRLARRHHVSIKDLMNRLVLPETTISAVSFNYRFTAEYARSINGYGKYATELHAALRRLTLVQGLELSTFLPWRGLFNPNGAGLLHPRRRWCPSCISDTSIASSDGDAHPLIWACISITHCQMHGIRLIDACMKCQAPQAQISDSFSAGRCGTCGASLGWRAGLFEDNQLPERQSFVSKAVCQMIAASSNAVDIGKPENFAAGIRRIAMQTSGGAVTRLARSIQIDYKVMSSWINLHYQPRFDSFIEACYRLGIMPLDLLGATTTQTMEPRLRPGSEPLKRPFHKLTDDQLIEAKKAISALLSSERYVSARQFAVRVGTTVGHLRYRLPNDYRALVEHARRLKAAATERRRVEKVELATSVARDLSKQGLHVPARKLASALEAKGLSILCPIVRMSAKNELRRLRFEWSNSTESNSAATAASEAGGDAVTEHITGPRIAPST